MTAPSRYEIIDTIATGDFATVYRGRDRELGREVAIKQIHPQYLADPAQLERYWSEAQLLASLQHPNVVTIYDLVRSKGWIILELMRGSLRRGPQSKPLDLDLLRMVLLCSLGALRFLHTNAVIHGDVKPSNMLVDAQNRVKLGDFGLARRASNAEGSLLKGTTKYMAPELMSADFGPVGPASDLYSLGFSAYELMCGSQFAELFPGLGSYGRDEQIAWMMWHSAPDRRLPEINRVLQGVPENLARVIQRLSLKDQRQRYGSAAEALRDLEAPAVLLDRPPEQADPAAEAARAAARTKRLRRVGLIVAAVCSLALSIVMLLPPAPQEEQGPPPLAGVLRQPYQTGQDLQVVLPDGAPRAVPLRGETRTFLNDRPALPIDLRTGDKISVTVLHGESGRLITELRATRPELTRGTLASLASGERIIELTPEGGPAGQTLRVAVPKDLRILFNGQPARDGKPVSLADLAVGDGLVVRHVAAAEGPRLATELGVLRVVTSEGVLRGVDPQQGTLTIAQGEGDNPTLVSLPLADPCEVTINGRRVLGQKTVVPADLRPGDRVKVAHDDRALRVDAHRVLAEQGTVARIDYDAGRINLRQADAAEPKTYAAGPKTAITLAGQTATLADLRVGDSAQITHDQPETPAPEALSIAAVRPANPQRFAAVVTVENYDDPTLGRLVGGAEDAKLLRQALVQRQQVPEGQALLLIDAGRARLEQELASFLARVGAASQLTVYYGGRAYRDADGKVYLAPKDFDPKRMADSGLALQWLVDRLEESPAQQKLLLLGAGPTGPGAEGASQPSAAEMLQSLRAPPNRGPLRTVTAVAGCSASQQMHPRTENRGGLFAAALAEGLSGRADANRDGRLEPTEVFAFLQGAMRDAGAQTGATQTPSLVLPDNRPPRLSDDAQKAIRRLATVVEQERIDAAAAESDYAAAAKLAGKEIEPALLHAMILMRTDRPTEAFREWESLKIEHPDLRLPLEGMAWLRFLKTRTTYEAGVNELVDLVGRIPKPAKPGEGFGPDVLREVRWAGQLREFVASAAPESQRPRAALLARLDEAVAALGPELARHYEEGRKESRRVWDEFDQRLRDTQDEATLTRLRLERHWLVRYASFPYREIVRQILEGLDE